MTSTDTNTPSSPAPAVGSPAKRARTIYPVSTSDDPTRPSIFLAGAIDQGAAPEWQREITALLSDLPIDIYNPRRLDWDKNLEQSKACQTFREQVNWELDHLDKVDMIAMFYPSVSEAPITLLELGLHASVNPERIVVGCEDGYYRKGNVDIVCGRYGVLLVNTLEELACEVRNRMEAKLAEGLEEKDQ